MNNNKKNRLLHGPLLYLMLLAAILAVVWMLDSDSPATYQDLSYSELLDWVETDLRTDNGETPSKEDAGCAKTAPFRTRISRRAMISRRSSLVRTNSTMM